ncbi:hypothetical protein DPMN_174768 [Dreissena polymorpha]|nr:hypothetical protein DPMN_174768 [Dreissena polymorpha]
MRCQRYSSILPQDAVSELFVNTPARCGVRGIRQYYHIMRCQRYSSILPQDAVSEVLVFVNITT